MKTCLIIGNGPSLADIPNEFLAKYPTFGSNRVYLKFTPDYYSFVDKLWVGNYIDDINKLTSKEKFIRNTYAHLVPGSHPIFQISGYDFSFKPLEYVHGGFTITYVNMQLAYYYGFERVGLIGVDHYYVMEGPALTHQTGPDKSHFTPDYYQPTDTWCRPEITKNEPSYRIAKKVFEDAGREIVNLTPGSKLDVCREEDWHDWNK